MLDDPEADLNDLMQHVKGPDFPTRGIIMGRSGIRAAYATGRGQVVIRARTEFEEYGHDRIRIIVTELPYQVNKTHAGQEHRRSGAATSGWRASPVCGTSPTATACASSSS